MDDVTGTIVVMILITVVATLLVGLTWALGRMLKETVSDDWSTWRRQRKVRAAQVRSRNR
jgi:membrane protein YqaA with SNARE-associated domain